jgi:hypothetical protein
MALTLEDLPNEILVKVLKDSGERHVHETISQRCFELANSTDVLFDGTGRSITNIFRRNDGIKQVHLSLELLPLFEEIFGTDHPFVLNVL